MQLYLLLYRSKSLHATCLPKFGKTDKSEAPLECPHPHPPYQGQPAAEEAAHTAIEEAAHTNMPPDTAADTPRDIEADTPLDNTEGDTPPPDNVDNDVAADTMSGTPSEMDPFVKMRPQQHQL